MSFEEVDEVQFFNFLKQIALLFFIVKKFFPNVRSQDFIPVSSSRSFGVLLLTIQTMIHFELSFLDVLRERCLFIYACEYPTVPAPFIKKTILSPLNCHDTIVKNQMTMNVRVYFGFFYPVSLSTSQFLCQYHTIQVIIALQ